ncbi:hypothetical protein AAG906_000344 [Vitis piasezkii]
MEELEYAQNAVGEFGGDNRAGIEGTLHRISAIRSRNGVIVGLTCRVGRAVSGHVDMIRDLLPFGESILFVGRPGVGKTTVMREIARVLSDELNRRVVIVDTSNEIGGDGDIPHAAIGGARRMQVPEPSMQHRIMIEAVENHMPEVIIVDEIGTEAEALACRSIAERGIMLIGTAHGERLENIIKNPTLSDLVGGIETVTLGDAEARARRCQKSILERKALPTFPFLIEMRERHYWVTHWTQRSVDMLLHGKRPLVEVRRRNDQFEVVIERAGMIEWFSPLRRTKCYNVIILHKVAFIVDFSRAGHVYTLCIDLSIHLSSTHDIILTLVVKSLLTLYSVHLHLNSKNHSHAFVVACFCEPTDLISSCLTRHNVNNFTVLPHKQNESPAYYRLLNFSIQNLRYAVPTAPKPVAIVLPQSREQLVNTVSCCREGLFEIRVRCGGHSYEGTSSVVLDGNPFVIIDMMSLNQVLVDLESETAWVEGGATLGETYYAVAEASNVHGFSAGSCPTVGVGGHISGGGFGLLSRKYGLAADNVVDALLIDADGRLVDREAMGEDVFWAIRGGGGGVWGIVYAWRIKLLKVPETVTSCIMSRTGTKLHVAELVHKWQFIAPRLEPSFYLSVFVGAGLLGGKETGVSASFKGFYLGSRSKAMSILNRVFPELGIEIEECREMSWIESVAYFGLRTALDTLEKEPKGYVILDPYGGEMERISSDAIAFPHRKGNLFAIQYMVAWEEDSLMSYKAAYVNYMDLDLGVMEMVNSSFSSGDPVEIARAWGEKYFLNNYERLVRVKTLIDPNNVFNNQQGIPPMLTAGFK